MFINNFNPIAIQILSLEIRWYSLAYIAGILIGWTLSKKVFISNPNLKEKFDDYITYIILGIIVGGRLGYVLFYNLNYYLNNFFDIFKSFLFCCFFCNMSIYISTNLEIYSSRPL